ncbi:coiled-coil domain-containing protein 138 [Tympanuchus pallidicinctus]|uniref:coiled-coil domain-containing protein 138 n=1 Tax=Tympanuchus pallidicinctus TaxID=109042 RepID=UPI0022874539|nr:coiled-coil domain-containing protein 138 [Tympanuchus pallidicinctus]
MNKKRTGKVCFSYLEWKHQFIMAEMYKDTCEVAQQMTPFMQEEVRAASKGNKLPPNSEVYGLLTVLMDWILDELLSKLKKQEERQEGQKPQCSGRTYIQESCLCVFLQLLPVAAEQLQCMSFVNPKLHMPLMRLIHWFVRQLDNDTKVNSLQIVRHFVDPTMAEMIMRLAEDIFTGIRNNGDVHSSSSRCAKSESKSALFFTSPFMPLRFLSTMVVFTIETPGKLWVLLNLFIMIL